MIADLEMDFSSVDRNTRDQASFEIVVERNAEPPAFD